MKLWLPEITAVIIKGVFNLKSIHPYSYQSSFVSKHLNDKMQSKIEIDVADVNQSKSDRILLAALHSNHLCNSP